MVQHFSPSSFSELWNMEDLGPQKRENYERAIKLVDWKYILVINKLLDWKQIYSSHNFSYWEYILLITRGTLLNEL